MSAYKPRLLSPLARLMLLEFGAAIVLCAVAAMLYVVGLDSFAALLNHLSGAQ